MTIQSGQYQSESHEPEAIELESIVIDPPVLYLEKGKTALLKAFAVWSDGTRTEITEQARWSTGESRVGFVTDPGLVTVESNGMMVIEAIYEERQAESVVVAVASQNYNPEPKERETGTREPSTKELSSKKRTNKESVNLEEASNALNNATSNISSQSFRRSSKSIASSEQASAAPAIRKQPSYETIIMQLSEKNSAKKAMIVLAAAVVLVGGGGLAVNGLNHPSAPAASAVKQNEGAPSQAPTPTSTESAGIGETTEQPPIPTLTPSSTQSESQTAVQTSDQQQAPMQLQPVQPPSSSQTNSPTAQTNPAKPSQPQTSTKLTPTITTKQARPAATKPVTTQPTASKPKATTTTTTTTATKPVKSTKTAQLIPVQQGGKWGYATSDGFGGKTLVVPYQFDHATGFSDGLALVKQNGKFGYINSKGQLVIPAQFDYATPFAGGKATVKQNGKLGTIDKSGVFSG